VKKKMKRPAKQLSEEPLALIALKRAAKKAVEIARQTGTAAYVLKNGKIVDISRNKRRMPKA
jgi:hypothetical protein